MPKINKGLVKQDAAPKIILESQLACQVKIGDMFTQHNEPPYADTVSFYEVIKILGHNSLIVGELNQSNSFLDEVTYNAPIPHQFISHPIEVYLDADRILRNNIPLATYTQFKTIDIGLDHPLHYYDTVVKRK